MIQYDAQVIRAHAQALYDQALVLVIFWTLVSAVVGGGITALIFYSILQKPLAIWLTAAVIGGGLCGGLSYFIGQSKASLLRLRAQMALCLVQIENNTRSAHPNADGPPGGPADWTL